MTKREAAVLSVFTNNVLCDLKDYHTYISEILGRPGMANELTSPDIWKKIQELAKSDADAILGNLE